MTRRDRLTTRERQVVRLLRAGRSYRQIALELAISENTVRSFIRRAYAALGVTSRYDLPRV